MEFNRILLVGALALTLMMLYQAWQQDYGPKPVAVEQAAFEGAADLPGAPQSEGASVSAGGDGPSRNMLESGGRIRVVTDVINAEIDSMGGDLRRVELPAYPVSIEAKDQPFVLMSDNGDSDLFIAQSGLLAAGDAKAPSHRDAFGYEKQEYSLADGEETLVVPLVWRDEASGIEVIKRYTFTRGSYSVAVDTEVRNSGSAEWRAHPYRQLQRSEPMQESSMFMYTYTGGVIYSEEEKYEKIEFDDMRESDLKRNITGGWAAMIQHYFLSAWIPGEADNNSYYSKTADGGRYILGMFSPEMRVAAGESVTNSATLYTGPKIQDKLEVLSPGLELTVDYGFLTIIAKPLFWLLQLIHGVVGNWGWAIILLTVLIKAAFYKLSAASYKSMAQMRKLQPKLQSLKERYGDDRQAMGEQMMKLYREEKINPLGGCLPILVQIPVFIALYWMLMESVELRQAPFMFWIQDLSIADPYFVLPIIMGATMLIQHKLNPTPMDPMQAKVMMVLPIVFTFFFLFFPAGLVLYWVVNNTLSIAQQWYITRVVVKA